MRNINHGLALLAVVAAMSVSANANAAIKTRQIDNVTITTDTSARYVTISVAGDQTKFRYNQSTGIAYVIEAGVVVAQRDLSVVNLEAKNGSQLGAATVSQLHKQQVGMAQPKSYAQNLYEPYPCSFEPCSPFYQTPLNPYFSDPYESGYDPYEVSDNPDGQTQDPGPSAELRELDQWLWEQHQEHNCQVANGVAEQFILVGTAVATFGSCAAAETGFGALGCLGGGAAVIAMAAQMDAADAICNASYPGYRNW